MTARSGQAQSESGHPQSQSGHKQSQSGQAQSERTVAESAATGATILRVRDVAVRYIIRGRIFTRGRSDRWALGGVSFELKAGETLGVVGRNGAGKTTLLRLLAGILGPDRGIVERRPGVRASLLSLQVGFLPQLTGRENATLSGMLLGLRRAELETRLASIVEFAELDGVMDDAISTWSDGMRARLGFSVAYHADPELLLLDEVLGTGDAGFYAKSAAAIRERIRSDRTCVLVSHDLTAMAALCDRCVWIERGRVNAVGAPADVLSAYSEAMHTARVSE
jgi:lipopolysaccharide transport system ATP-binding protein